VSGPGSGHLPRTPARTLERARAVAWEKFIAAENPQTLAKSRCTAKIVLLERNNKCR
jgi:hypothetical protein